MNFQRAHLLSVLILMLTSFVMQSNAIAFTAFVKILCWEDISIWEIGSLLVHVEKRPTVPARFRRRSRAVKITR